MKITFFAIILQLFILFPCFSQNKKDHYNRKEFNTLYDFFEYKRDLIKFMEFEPGQNVADIGSGEGYHECALALIYDSLNFYMEEVDPKELNHKELDKNIKHYTKLKGSPFTCTFDYRIGTYKTTNLPDGIFDKVIMIASFHEFGFMDEMMEDIAKKLKPGGKIYVMEAFCIDKVISCSEGHKGYYMKDVNSIMNKIGYYQTQQNSPESYIINYANIMVFEQNKTKSDLFFSKKEELQPFLAQSFLFDKKEIAADQKLINSICDSLLPVIGDLSNQYVVYEVWLKNIGLKWQKSEQYPEAINILKACTVLFPSSAENYLALANAYKEDKQHNLANVCYKKACELGWSGKYCSKKE